MTEMKALYEKTGGATKGDCHPKDCIELLPGAGMIFEHMGKDMLFVFWTGAAKIAAVAS